jgi:YihY family inner membrane protein
MSTATPVPETHRFAGDDARETLAHISTRTMLRDTLARLRWADGFSHARATAFQVVLTLIPGMVVLIALAAQLQWPSLSNAIIRSADSIAPGQSSQVFRDAFDKGSEAGDAGNWTAIGFGAVAMLISGTTAFGQVERTANRIYGVERDRPSTHKYAHAAVLMLVAGTFLALYFAAVGLGSGWGSNSSTRAHWWWEVGRWLLGLVFLSVAVISIFKWSPRRRQPGFNWLAAGTGLAIAGVIIVSLLLSLYLSASSSFGDTYGPLAGFLGLLLWAYLSAIAVYLGLAFAAQLEAVRAGVVGTRSEAKVDAGEPDSTFVSYGTALRQS